MKPLTHSPDLKRLYEQGYEIQVRDSHIIIHSVPYLNSDKKPTRGIIVSSIENIDADNIAHYGSEHVVFFAGEKPYNANGTELTSFSITEHKAEIIPGLKVNYQFSAKRDYKDYYEKITAYVKRLREPLLDLGFKDDARTFLRHRSGNKSPHRFDDTNSSRAGMTAINNRVAGQKIAIIGIGGTGSYVLDFISKMPVKEIHLFDEDTLLSHNAFRAPGSPSRKQLRAGTKKVDYHARTYSRMHKGVVAHPYSINSERVNELNDKDFVFLSLDGGTDKQIIIEHLKDKSIPFVDVGLSIRVNDDVLRGQLITTLILPEHFDETKAYLTSNTNENNGIYKTNVQIAELNALNACFAIIAWKRHNKIYDKIDGFDHMVYKLRNNSVII